MPTSSSVTGQIVDVHRREIFPGAVHIAAGRVRQIERLSCAPRRHLLPGLVDAHIHIESSMLAPAEFARAAAVHGTVAVVSDPHEIANVLGIEGVNFMIEEARHACIKIFHGASPCVPATGFETAGATLDAAAVDALLARPEISHLSEVMNFPGVLSGDTDLLEKIASAVRHGKPVDGHAPGLRGTDALRYAAAGISTDHECCSLDEALDKLAAGMHILLREGSAARNLEALSPLLRTHPEHCMFCTDDLHPDALANGHIDALVRSSLRAGHDVFDILQAASVNPVLHYRLPVGLLREGDPADFIVVDDLDSFQVLETHVNGLIVARAGHSTIAFRRPSIPNRFQEREIFPESLRIPATHSSHLCRIIVVTDGQLVTQGAIEPLTAQNGFLDQDPSRDILKLVVVNRYHEAPPAVAFVRGFGITRGAIASSVAHDSHNIIAAGTDDRLLARAINLVMNARGGVCSVSDSGDRLVPLPVAGLMSDAEAPQVAANYAAAECNDLGSSLRAPLMTLSFLALLVIPKLKLSDRGLFDGEPFEFCPVIVDQCSASL